MVEIKGAAQPQLKRLLPDSGEVILHSSQVAFKRRGLPNDYSGERECPFRLNVNTFFLNASPTEVLLRVFTFSQFPEVVFSLILFQYSSMGVVHEPFQDGVS